MKQKQVLVISLTVVILVAGFVMAFNTSEPEHNQSAQSKTTTSSTATQVKNANIAPDFSLTTIDGKTISMADFKGKGVILNFWATWCPPCRAEIPDMIELQSAYETKNFSFIGVAVGDRLENVKAFVEKQKINYPIVMGSPEITNDYGKFIDGGIRGIPTSFIINTKGEVLGHFVGARSKEIFEEAIIESLKEK